MNQKPVNYIVLHREDYRKTIRKWWKSLKDERKDRAQLRRCEDSLQVILLPGFHRLLNQMEGWPQNHIQGLAATAGLLSQVKENTTHRGEQFVRFGQQIGCPKEQGGKPPVSELRFYQLSRSRTHEEFYRHIRRTIWLLDGNVNIMSLADFILQWDQEKNGEFEKEPERRFPFRLAQDYFSQLI